MMGVFIKGMEMPTNCQDCPLNYDQMACIVTGTRWWSDTIVLMGFDSEKERLYDCPLTEVKEPHGRLIDADKLDGFKLPSEKQDFKTWHKHSAEYKNAVPIFNSALDLVKNSAQTVIEAEE